MLIDIPCKIGDEAWAVRNFSGQKRIRKGIVTEMFFISHEGLYDMRLVVVVGHISRGHWGKQIFGTYEEALAALEGGATDTNVGHREG